MNDFPDFAIDLDPAARAMVDHVFGHRIPAVEHLHGPPPSRATPRNLTAAAALASGIIAASGKPHTVADAVAVLRETLAALDAEDFNGPPDAH